MSSLPIISLAGLRSDDAGQRRATAAELGRACREAGVDYELLDTARPYADALRAYLDKRKRLY